MNLSTSGFALGYLDSAGPRADTVLPLTWYTLIVSVVVCLIIAVLLWGGVRRARRGDDAGNMRRIPISSGANGVRWITMGVLISSVPLAVALVWTMLTLAAVAGPPANPGLVLDVSAHQYWWEVKYNGPAPSDNFSTANEIHIPLDVPVLVRLHGSDVIHSFWVPKLSGKTDAIPGQTNVTWMQAAVPGRYRGQCAEFCGWQHAHMQLEVVAEPQAQFEAWRAAQLRSAPAPATADQTRGLSFVVYRCGLCHQIRGTQAAAVTGPDLTHVMSRRLIAAGALPNDPAHLAQWIQTPQHWKLGSRMPDQQLSAPQLSDTLAYLELLR